jgi:DNA anti-recombination protein RmuC
MYTNNGSKPLVDFVNDVFTYVTKSHVFDDVFYYHHKLRVKKNGKPNPQKTWLELKILLKSIGAPDTVSPKNVLFFDDQEHTSLISTLKKNYIRVTAYNYKPPLAKLINIYEQSLSQSELLSDNNKKRFLLYIKGCTKNKLAQNIDEHLNLLSATSSKYINNINLEFPNDTKFGSNYMLKSIKKLVDESQKKLAKTLKQNYKTSATTKFTYKRR